MSLLQPMRECYNCWWFFVQTPSIQNPHPVPIPSEVTSPSSVALELLSLLEWLQQKSVTDNVLSDTLNKDLHPCVYSKCLQEANVDGMSSRVPCCHRLQSWTPTSSDSLKPLWPMPAELLLCQTQSMTSLRLRSNPRAVW